MATCSCCKTDNALREVSWLKDTFSVLNDPHVVAQSQFCSWFLVSSNFAREDKNCRLPT